MCFGPLETGMIFCKGGTRPRFGLLMIGTNFGLAGTGLSGGSLGEGSRSGHLRSEKIDGMVRKGTSVGPGGDGVSYHLYHIE